MIDRLVHAIFQVAIKRGILMDKVRLSLLGDGSDEGRHLGQGMEEPANDYP